MDHIRGPCNHPPLAPRHRQSLLKLSAHSELCRLCGFAGFRITVDQVGRLGSRTSGRLFGSVDAGSASDNNEGDRARHGLRGDPGENGSLHRRLAEA